MRTTLSDADIAAFAPSEKIGIVGTVDEGGEPRLSILTTIMGYGPAGLTIGEFSRGESKRNMARRNEVGFLVMSLDRRIWRGAATWKEARRSGPEYEAYNRQPMFRYNSYFGIDTVHYLDLVDIDGPEPLPMPAVVAASLATAMLAPFARPVGGERIMPPPALRILDSLASLNFACFLDGAGYPRIVPVIQARSAGPSRIVFSPGPWRDEILAIPAGTRVALLSMNLGMESFMARGRLNGVGGGLLGMDLDYLYNSAPPCHGQVYPPKPLEAAVIA